MELRRTPFYQAHADAGARIVPFAGYEMPVQYAGVAREHLQVRASVGLFDVSHMGEVRVRGPGAEDALMWLLSNAIRRIPTLGAQYNALCNERGGMVDDVFVYKTDRQDFMICVNAANRASAFDWMVRNNPCPETAEFTDEGDAWAQVAVQGPAGAQVVDRLVGFDATQVARHRFVVGSFAGVAGCVIARTGYTGEDGFEVFIPASDAPAVWDRILEAGVDHGIVPVGLGARDTLRLEAGNCLYGHEINEDTTPLQAGLGWVTKLRKPGGFLGSAAIERRTTTDRLRKVHLVLLGKRIPRAGMAVHAEQGRVGEVTSGTKGPSIEQGIAMAFVEASHTAPGTTLHVDVRGRSEAAVVIEGSFTDWKKRQSSGGNHEVSR